jgi:hypothetical protein
VEFNGATVLSLESAPRGRGNGGAAPLGKGKWRRRSLGRGGTILLGILYEFTTIPLPLPPFFWVFFISSILILQMVNTRNRVSANNAKNNGDINNQKVNPLPPPLLTLEQGLAM